jgi:hypothetical protein
MGTNSSGTSVNYYSKPVVPAAAGTAQIFTNAQNVVYATCYFGGAYTPEHLTQVAFSAPLETSSGSGR